MIRHLIVLPDGREIFSGEATAEAVASVSLTQAVNSGSELTLGSVCASMLEAKLITPEGALSLYAGEEITLYRVQEDVRRKVGVFILEKPTKDSPHSMKLTAFDRVVKLDKDLSSWLAGLEEWPYTLFDLAALVCSQCGVTLQNEEIPNGGHYVQKFSCDGVTGRQLMRWIGQAAGSFCVATEDGNLKFDWYKETDTVIGGDIWYYQNGLRLEDYRVQPIQRVQLRQTAEDVGTVYPDTVGNTYVIEGNPLLAAADAEALLPVAQTLYDRLKDVSYTPGKVSIPMNWDIGVGEILSVTDGNGRGHTLYVMEKVGADGRDALSCAGSARRESAMAVNNQTIRQYMGKVLNLSMTVDGIRAENKDMQGNLGALQLDLSGISGQVETNTQDTQGLKKDMAQMQLTAQSLQLDFTALREEGIQKVTTATGYTFDAEGLKIQRSGTQMENKLDDTGMTVSRGGTAILQATAEGVQATDVKVNNFLCVGNCRFEDYTNGADSRRTACFFTGEGG